MENNNETTNLSFEEMLKNESEVHREKSIEVLKKMLEAIDMSLEWSCYSPKIMELLSLIYKMAGDDETKSNVSEVVERFGMAMVDLIFCLKKTREQVVHHITTDE